MRAVWLSLLLCWPATMARADAVGVLDPVAAEICGGSVHHPRCPPSLLGGACCGGIVLLLTTAAFVRRGRSEGPREGPR